MGEDSSKVRSRADEELEREVRKGRKFSIDEAVGRMIGPGGMKGASPIDRKRQAEAEIGNYLRFNAGAASECLQVVLLRQIVAGELLLKNLDSPLMALATYLQRILGSEYQLKELVRETDAEWGSVFCERPYFDVEGSPAHPEDPYTYESVRRVLSGLVARLNTGS